MEKKTEAQSIEELIKSDKLKILKPNECGLLYDEKGNRIFTFCNKDGKIEMKEKKLRSRSNAGKKV